jgi:hypothetical protein
MRITDLTPEEWGEVELYQNMFNEPAQPSLAFGHVQFSAAQMLKYARQGIAQGHPIDWEAEGYELLDEGQDS